MFYLPPFLFIFIFLLLHNFIIFLPQVFYSLLRNFIMFFPLPPPRLFYIFFHPQKKSTSYRPYIDPTLNFFFCNTASWKVKKKTTTFLLFFHHYHISIAFPPPPPHFYCFSPTPPPPPPPQFYCFSPPPPPPPPPPPHFYCFHSSCCFVIWVWSFWPEVGLFGLWLASDPLKDKKAALLLPKKTANSSGTPLLIVSLH